MLKLNKFKIFLLKKKLIFFIYINKIKLKFDKIICLNYKY